MMKGSFPCPPATAFPKLLDLKSLDLRDPWTYGGCSACLHLSRESKVMKSKTFLRLLLAIFCTTGAGSFVAESNGAAPDQGDSLAQAEFFEKKIRPVLVTYCYECHSSTAAQKSKLKGGLLGDSKQAIRRGGDSGPAVVPGNTDDSLLISALNYDGLEMPPKGKLSDAVIADFQQWIASGAFDPRDEQAAVPAARTIDVEEGRKHWSYQRPVEPKLPVVQRKDWDRTPIDLFVLQRLEQRGWAPARDAEPATLIRRLYFDLIGLPPTPEQIDEFTSDPSQQNYAAIVERLMDSPRFGERWARHWLDVARYGESNTLRGTVFGEAWRYRDWTIDAFNDDMPFDTFIRQQIAGDLLPAADYEQERRQIIATGLLALGNTNFENQDKQQLRMDAVDEQLETIGRAFLAQTITCARCHDHKFDPIPTKDYYALAGILRNTKTLVHANVSRWIEVPLPATPDADHEIKQHNAKVADMRAEIAALKKQLDPGGQPGDSKYPKSVSPETLPGIVVDSADAFLQGEWMESQFTAHYVGDNYIHDIDQGKGAKSVSFEVQLPEDGQYDVRFSYSSGTNRATNVPVSVVSAGNKQATLVVNQRKRPELDGLFHPLGRFQFSSNEAAHIVISNNGTNGHVIVDAVQFLPAGTADAEEPAKAVEKANPEEVKRLQSELKKLEGELKSLQAKAPQRERAMSVQEEAKIEDTHVHIRGNVHSLGEPAPRGFLQVATYAALPEFSDRESGRRELADWIASNDNPLTARVAVNRIWHWLFGAGLVRTTDNFGSVGESPSHPELLDYLAIQFQKDGWSVKQTIQRIVLSRTYQMTSKVEHPLVTQPGKTVDPDPENRLLWRFNRRRHDAESLRDTILSVSGRLSFEMYGPTYRNGTKSDYDYQYTGVRRSVYVPMFRNSLPDIFDAFDFADTSMVVGRRSTSTVAPQALFMMNNPFVINEAAEAARRLLSETPDAADQARLELAYRRTLGRPPYANEQAIALNFLDAHQDEAKEKAWADLFQAMFATLDFRYLD